LRHLYSPRDGMGGNIPSAEHPSLHLPANRELIPRDGINETMLSNIIS
jgi:hypothetical protein